MNVCRGTCNVFFNFMDPQIYIPIILILALVYKQAFFNLLAKFPTKSYVLTDHYSHNPQTLAMGHEKK